jgi:hypothetical protein
MCDLTNGIEHPDTRSWLSLPSGRPIETRELIPAPSHFSAFLGSFPEDGEAAPGGPIRSPALPSYGSETQKAHQIPSPLLAHPAMKL